MKIKTFVAVAVFAAMISGCATGTVVSYNAQKIDAPREIGLDAPVEPWVAQIEIRLRQVGFKVKRMSRDQTKAFNPSMVRYVLVLNGRYYTGWEQRCFGGGYKFESLTAELIDLKENESLVSVSGEGYSENCPPASGTIYGDIAKAVTAQWNG